MDAESSSSLELPHQCRQLTISEIHLATRNFDKSLEIGRGGFGIVYKGTLTNGATHLVAAIKRLDSTSNQGAAEFRNEVQMLSTLRHCHLVSLIGYCTDEQEMILVYDYMPHGTLEDHLHKFQSHLPWVRRLKICIGAARGLDYLHTGTGIKHGVIHRDVKSSNILLDESWAAKISDFGLSKLGPINQPSSYVNTFVKGTFGYLDPDYYATGRLTRKSDVYAFGVVLFEVLSGKRAVDRSLDEEHWGLVNWAQESIREGRLKEIVDYTITEGILPKCLKEFAKLADRCLNSNPKQRPTMAEVVVCLESVLALQEKTNHTLQPSALRIFGNMVPKLLSWSNGESSVEGKRSLELYFNSIGGENRILRRFEFRTINVATDNFSESIKSWRLGGGPMYKGTLQNGQGVLIARHNSESGSQEYKNEAALLVNLQHENLIKLLGYCIEGTQVFLVYEFALCTRLDHVLFDRGCTLLDWNKRKKIILAVARVLLYLHQHDVVHGNVKPRNILLDESFHPKLSNFGSARCLPLNKVDCIEVDAIHQANRLSTKDDVHRFGVLILETMIGYNIRYFEARRTVWRDWRSGKDRNIIDPRIQASLSITARFILIGLLCRSKDAADRPTMEEVVAMLTNNNLPVPKLSMPTWIIENDSDVASRGKAGSEKSLELYFDSIGGENRILRKFEFGIINVATENFSENYKNSPCGDGSMYKGTLQNGEGVSITRHNSESGSQDYKNEVAVLVKLEHENLLKLLGYCIEETQVFLVYEFALCRSLDHVLFDRGCTILDWNKRKKIILAVARVLLYLQQHDVVHGNIKPQNILLDENFDPKLSDFGVARFLPINEDECIEVDAIHQANRLSTKDDVYAFGVLILETMIGYNMHDFEGLQTVWSDWWSGKRNIIDPRVHANLSITARFILIGLLCRSKDAADRPTMEEVVAMLTNNNLPVPKLSMPTWIIENDSDVAPPGKVGSKRSSDLHFDSIEVENRIIHRFEFGIINVATENFSENNKISPWGYHGFTMYKGRLQSGQDVSVARHKFGCISQAHKNEVALLVKLEHENLLKLLGYSINGTEIILVYEFALCGSLDRMLFDRGCTLLDWNRRKRIILAVARALLHLHQHDVIHGNVKPGNILLDESFDPKLSDLGFARCLPTNEVNKLSTKDDVYGYGVLILEIMTGYNIHYFTAQRTLLRVWRDWWLGKDRNMIDRRIHANLSITARFILIGLLCISRDAADRPTMEEVVAMLTNNNLPIPKLPMPTWIIENNSDVANDTKAITDAPKYVYIL